MLDTGGRPRGAMRRRLTPALRQASEPLPLTDREAEIVMLIGEGLSNRAVAERLTLSVRTVESHIYRAMMKTGTTSRDELAALLAASQGIYVDRFVQARCCTTSRPK